jgi:hypothetical protein
MPLRRLPLVLLALLTFALGASRDMPAYVAADPSAPPVTLDNLMANERFWPYQVELRADWQPAGGKPPLRPGATGVLVRVQPGGAARVDFGRDGLHEVPVASTDLVERANQVRLGSLRKAAPNLVHSIAPRLVDSESESPRNFDFAAAFAPAAFLSVFADPASRGFAELAAALAPLRARPGLLTVLYPQGAYPDMLATRQQLRALGWPVPFVMDSYAEAYTRSQLGEDTPLPALMLHTREGRLLYRGAWSGALPPELSSALDGLAATAPTPH